MRFDPLIRLKADFWPRKAKVCSKSGHAANGIHDLERLPSGH
jgi:hypothetical protein